MTAQLDTLLTADQLAKIMNVKKRTIWRWLAEGRIPKPIYLTRQTPRWRESEVKDFIAAKAS